LLLTELVKVWFEELGGPFPIIVTDGGKRLGVFHPDEFPNRKKTTIPDFPPEFVAELKRRVREEEEGRANYLTTEECLRLLETEDGRKRLGL